MSKRKQPTKKQDPILELGYIMTLLCFFLMLSFTISFNPLPLLVSIIGFATGLYLITLIKYPKEAKYWREFIIDKLNLLVNWVKEIIQNYRERRRKNSV